MSVDVTLSRLPSRIVRRRAWSNEGWRHAHLTRVVAIPACNEEARVVRCLASLAAQRTDTPFGVLVFVNGTTDTTFRRVVAHARRHPQPLCVVDARLPKGRHDAGAARCAAMALARNRLDGHGGIVFTTDADSIVPCDWLAGYGRLLSHGIDVVAGASAIHAQDANGLLRSLRQRGELEDRYEACLDAIESLLDPVSHDPWPRHYQASGANLAVSRRCLDALAQLPWPAAGEDKFIVAQAEAHGMRVRHDTFCTVLTSGRIFGRARGGMAEAMRHRLREPECPCDPRLEPVDRAYFRARVRALCRVIHASGPPCIEDIAMLSARLHVGVERVARALDTDCFGAAWAELERCSPKLRRDPIRPGQLMHQCARAEALLSRLGGTHRSPVRLNEPRP
jgi:hypothetical protein